MWEVGMSANLRLRTIAVLYMLIAALSALFMVMVVLFSDSGDYGPRAYQIVMIFGSIAIIAGGLGGGLWCLKNIARWLLFGVHVVFGLMSLSILFQGAGIGLGLTLLSINLAIALVLFFSEPDPWDESESPLDSFLAKIGSQLRSALWFAQTDAWVRTWPNIRLRIVAVLYLLAALLSLLLMVNGIAFANSGDYGPRAHHIVMFFGGIIIITTGLGAGLWHLKDIARWLVIGIHVVFGLLSINAILQGNDAGFDLFMLLANSVIVMFLFFSKPTYWYEA
jgi:hypothetical protein